MKLRKPCPALDGKTIVYRRDPIFGREVWCLKGSLVAEMQTMEWVNALIPEKGEIGREAKSTGTKATLL